MQVVFVNCQYSNAFIWNAGEKHPDTTLYIVTPHLSERAEHVLLTSLISINYRTQTEPCLKNIN